MGLLASACVGAAAFCVGLALLQPRLPSLPGEKARARGVAARRRFRPRLFR